MKWTVYQTGPAGWDVIKQLVSGASWSDIAFMPYNSYNQYHPLHLKAVATPEQGDLICWPTGNRCLVQFGPSGWIDWHMTDSGSIELTNVTHGGYIAKSWQIEQLKPLDKLIVDEQLGTIKQDDIDYIRRQVGPDSNWEKTYRRSKAEEKEMLESALSGKQQEEIKIRQHARDSINGMYKPKTALVNPKPIKSVDSLAVKVAAAEDGTRKVWKYFQEQLENDKRKRLHNPAKS